MPKLCACLLFAMTCSHAFAMFLYGPLPKAASEFLDDDFEDSESTSDCADGDEYYPSHEEDDYESESDATQDWSDETDSEDESAYDSDHKPESDNTQDWSDETDSEDESAYDSQESDEESLHEKGLEDASPQNLSQDGPHDDHKNTRAIKRKRDKIFKKHNRLRTISLHSAKKRVLETSPSRKQEKTALLLAKAKKKYFALQNREHNPPIETKPSEELAECALYLEVPQPESPDVIDGKWVYNRVDKKDRHMPPRGKLNESKAGFHVLSKKQLSQPYPDKQLKQRAPRFFLEPKPQPTCPVPGGIQIPWGWLL